MPFSKEFQPERKRGPANNTLVSRALKASGRDENALIQKVIERAFDDEDPQSAQLLKDLLARIAPTLKATVQPVDFEFPADGSHTDKLDAILAAVASGALAADVAVMVAGIVKTSLEVREGTDLAERLARIEAMLGAAE